MRGLFLFYFVKYLTSLIRIFIEIFSISVSPFAFIYLWRRGGVIFYSVGQKLVLWLRNSVGVTPPPRYIVWGVGE
jgi:hypothetical protein